MGWRDDWPLTADGHAYDGQNLFRMAQRGKSPFSGAWDVNLLIKEIEENLQVRIIDLPFVDKGSNNYGIHFKTADGKKFVARLARGDVNMPGYDGFTTERQTAEVLFEAATYKLLQSESDIKASLLLYSRGPIDLPGPKAHIPSSIVGRRLFVFDRAEGKNNVWKELSADNKLHLLTQLSRIRASLFNFPLPPSFTTSHLHSRLFDFKPDAFTVPITPTRAFWLHVMTSKIEATVRNEDDPIGWEDDNETVGPVALAAKHTLLRALPYLLPHGNEDRLYRFVLEHGDFGIHNTSIMIDKDGRPEVTSLYDWETGNIVPAILSDPLVAVDPVDLVVDAEGMAGLERVPEASTEEEMGEYGRWTEWYVQKLYEHSPDYDDAIKAGKDIRYLWFALRDWRGGDSEAFFGGLGEWAERRLFELGIE
ncbi:3-hydroxybutyryl-CoA dehydratase [Phaeosphaeria sp. MPI-PUGE-AT-0046c]|nr:3-hydroxybutyryl-CoA dehydratase [Phaeosphaeria sp. MPI-PUGE-AT-0046c]